MSKLTDRDRLLRLVRGENLDESIRYYIEYSLDIRGNITIWGGMSFLPEEENPLDDPRKKVTRKLIPVYEYHHCSPYTLRVYQMEQDLDETIPDGTLIEEYHRFREKHQEDGFGLRMRLIQLPFVCCGCTNVDEEGVLNFRPDRDDKQEVLDRLLKQERRDIKNLWGVDCPPNVSDSENYGKRLSSGQGMGSDWFRKEFERIGGDWQKHLIRR